MRTTRGLNLNFITAFYAVLSIIVVNYTTFAQPSMQSGLFQFVRTVQVTPDTNFQTAAFVRVGIVPATNNLVVTYKGIFTHSINNLDGGYAYKEYNLDMQPTGKSGALYEAVVDIAGLMVGSNFYAVSMDPVGWRILKFDAVSWEKLIDITFPLDTMREGSNDMMVAFVNGQLDISSQCVAQGKQGTMVRDSSTHHELFSPDLEFLGLKILSNTANVCGSSMIYVDGIYYFVSSTDFMGDVTVMKYDSTWKYLGTKELIKEANMPEGLAFDGQRFYVSYLNTSQRTEGYIFPYPNVHLAAFDREWNLIEDVAVTNYPPSAYRATGRPWVLLHNSRLYVSYDQTVNDSITHGDNLDSIEAYVSIYDLNPNFTSVRQSDLLPMRFQLEQNYPNPFNPSTTIDFSIQKSGYAELKVYSITGDEVQTLVQGQVSPGNYEYTWNADKFSSGIYFYQLRGEGFAETKKMLLLK